MRTVFLYAVHDSARSFVLIVAGMLALGVGIGASLGVASVVASHDDPNAIHACVNEQSGQTRIITPGASPDCKTSEILVEWQSASAAADLAARVTTLETENEALTERIDEIESAFSEQAAELADLEEETIALTGSHDDLDARLPGCLTTNGGDAVFEGCDVHIRNGEGTTDTTNGTGNLIVGYNEERTLGGSAVRTGSHNVVIGPEHTYSSFGGFVAGLRNTVSNEHASVSGGTGNEASGSLSSISAGSGNQASAVVSSVSGGSFNEAIALHSSISGGVSNKAIGVQSSISGGQSNEATGLNANVSGGQFNTASGDFSSILGGLEIDVTESHKHHP